MAAFALPSRFEMYTIRRPSGVQLGKDLHGHAAPETRIVRAIDLTHAAAAKVRVYPVVEKLGANQWAGACECYPKEYP